MITYDVIPEIVGGIIGLKKMLPQDADENFIAISFGFGTVEGGLATQMALCIVPVLVRMESDM